MAVSEISVAAAPERVFAVLSDRASYGAWVVGTAGTRPAEGAWPAPGSSLRYRLAGPVPLSERTVVLAADEPRRLALRTLGGPLPDVDIVIDVEPAPGGSRVRLEERPARPLWNLLLGPLGHRALARRNDASLRRLRRLAEEPR